MIEFLGQKLGISTSDARILYDQWLENTLDTLLSGTLVTLEGLGSFIIENNELRFGPQPSLELDVNRAYAGLEPLSEEKLGPTRFTETDFDDPFIRIIAPKQLEPIRAQEPEPEPDAVSVSVPVPEPEPEPITTIPVSKKKPTSLLPWFGAVVVLVLLTVGGFLGFAYFEMWMETKLATEQAATAISAKPEVAPIPIQAPEVLTPTEPVIEYGLTGTPAVLEGRIYGIIVHSLPLRADSDAQCAKISPLGFRCSVVATGRNGATTYRVAIGQFESTAAAQTAVTDLPAEYQTPGNFFISRIQ